MPCIDISCLDSLNQRELVKDGDWFDLVTFKYLGSEQDIMTTKTMKCPMGHVNSSRNFRVLRIETAWTERKATQQFMAVVLEFRMCPECGVVFNSAPKDLRSRIPRAEVQPSSI